jgi:hypothetical protein
LVHDVASCGLVDDDLCPKENPLQAVLNIRHLRLGAFADEEIYGSSDYLTKDCRNYCPFGYYFSVALIKKITHTAAQRGFSPGPKGPLVLGCEPGLRFRD